MTKLKFPRVTCPRCTGYGLEPAWAYDAGKSPGDCTQCRGLGTVPAPPKKYPTKK